MQLPEKPTRAQFKFIKMMETFNVSPDSQEYEDAWKEAGFNEPQSKPVQVSVTRTQAVIADDRAKHMEREAELVLASLYNHDVVRVRKCKRCSQDFATNYNYERFCGNLCRAAALADRGIAWDFDKAEEDRWGGQPPSSISVTTLSALREWAKRILAHDGTPVEIIPPVEEQTTQVVEALPVQEVEHIVKAPKIFDWQ